MMSRLTRDQQSAVWVILTTVLALLLGLGVKTAVTNQTRPFTNEGLSAEVPAGWLMQAGQADLVLLARNPQQLNERYRVRLLPMGDDLAALAYEQNVQRIQLDEAYRVLAETPVIVNDREGYKVSFATVDLNEGGLPGVIEGADYYFPETSNTLVVSLQASSDTFTESQKQFQDFLLSITYGE
jgi:hypothetical protein